MKEKKNLTEVRLVALELENYGELVGYWTPKNEGGVLGEFESATSKVHVIRCWSQVGTAKVPTNSQLQAYYNRRAQFQNSINPTEATG